MGKISQEIDKLVSILEEEENLFLKRIQFFKGGDQGKVRFIDERIMPSLIQKQNIQALEVNRVFCQRLGDKNGRCKKEQTQTS